MSETMIRMGCRWTPSDRNRIAGKMEIHRRLGDNEFTGEPTLKVFNTCTNTVRQLAGIPLSKTNSEDVDTKAEDHAYDALRYMLMTRTSGYVSIHKTLNDIETSTFKPQDATFGY